MKKSIILPLMLLLGVSAAKADTILQLSMADGSTPSYLLSEQPRVTFTADGMNIATPSASIEHKRADVLRMNFTDDPTSIESILAGAQPTLSFTHGQLSAPGLEISLYDLQGALVARAADSVDVTALPQGIYVVRAGALSMKIVNK